MFWGGGAARAAYMYHLKQRTHAIHCIAKLERGTAFHIAPKENLSVTSYYDNKEDFQL